MSSLHVVSTPTQCVIAQSVHFYVALVLLLFLLVQNSDIGSGGGISTLKGLFRDPRVLLPLVAPQQVSHPITWTLRIHEGEQSFQGRHELIQYTQHTLLSGIRTGGEKSTQSSVVLQWVGKSFTSLAKSTEADYLDFQSFENKTKVT